MLDLEELILRWVVLEAAEWTHWANYWGEPVKTKESSMNHADGPQGAVFSVEDPDYRFLKLSLSLDDFGHTSACLMTSFYSYYAMDKLAKTSF